MVNIVWQGTTYCGEVWKGIYDMPCFLLYSMACCGMIKTIVNWCSGGMVWYSMLWWYCVVQYAR